MDKLFRPEGGDKIKCLACSHYCLIPAKQSGICGVRENDGGKLELLVYGRPCAVHVDPVEKKPLYHFMPGTDILSFGTFGCNFGCGFCQNWDISQVSRKDSIASVNGWKEFLKNIEYWGPVKAVEYARRQKISSIAYTYNEPTIWTEYAMDIAKAAKEQGIKNVYVSNGYMSAETREYVRPYLDAINIDLKSFRPEFYARICKAKLEPILENIREFHKMGVWVEITTLVIPGENDSPDELRSIAEFISSVSPDMPWHLSAFHADYQMTSVNATAKSKLIDARTIGKNAGLKYVYIGNIEAEEESNTYCPKCSQLLIGRGYMTAEITGLDKNKCDKCGEKIAGIFV